MLSGQFIPKDLPKRYDIFFLGEKPALYFTKHPEERWKGNFNVTKTDFTFQKWIRKYFKKSVYVTDMVKTEGKPGALFEQEWKRNPRFSEVLLRELKEISPRIVIAISKKVYLLFKEDARFSKWREATKFIYHPAYVYRYKKFSSWDSQFRNIIKELK